MPTHKHIISVVNWIKEHWLNALAITAWGTILLVVAAAVPFVTRRPRPGSEQDSDQLSRQRAIMLHHVRYTWITGVLEPSLADAARITLGLKPNPDVLDLGKRIMRRVGQPPEPFPEGTSIGSLFRQVGSGLLILGRPGGGKTTLLLQLADELLTRAESDPEQPIPVVFHLSSWASKPRPLGEWLAEQLTDNYDVPPPTASKWLAHGAIALLLDGLDEVSADRRAAWANAINAYRHDRGLVPIAVCSRTEELEQLAVRLRLNEAVELLPPTDAEIDRYLSYLEATGTPLADVRAALATDEPLRELLHSPLMLHVIALAYHGRPAAALDKPGTSERRREQLWRAYVTRMFDQRPLELNCNYAPAQAIEWLRWLAQALYNRNEAEFRLFQLSMDWCPSTMKRSRHGWLRKHRTSAPESTNAAGPAETQRTVDEPFAGPVIWLDFVANRAVRYVVLLWVAGATIATAMHDGPVTGLVAGLTCCFGTIACAAILGLLWQRMRNRYFSDKPTSPNERVWRAARDASIGGTIAALCLGTLYGSVLGIVYGPPVGLLAALITAAGAGLIAWLNIGGAIFLHHFAVRVELARRGLAPWKLPSFLEAMAERQLLRRSGGAYLFVHRMLRDFLATAYPDSPLDADVSMPSEPSTGDAATQ